MKRSFASGAACLSLVFAIVLSFGADTAEAQLFSRLRCKMAARKACAPAPTCCATPAPTCCATPAPTCCATPAPTCGCEASTCCDPCKKTGLLARLFAKKSCGCESSCDTGCSACGTTTTGCAGCEASPAPAAMDDKIVPPAPEATKEAAKPTT